MKFSRLWGLAHGALRIPAAGDATAKESADRVWLIAAAKFEPEDQRLDSTAFQDAQFGAFDLDVKRSKATSSVTYHPTSPWINWFSIVDFAEMVAYLSDVG
jgi:hypothetical protein